MQKFKFLLAFIILINFVSVAKAQRIYDTPCPTNATQPFQPLVTTNPQDGNLQANACVDSTGKVSFQGAAGAFSAGYIDPTLAVNGGVKANGGMIFDATFTLVQNTVTSATAKFLTGPNPPIVGMRGVGTCCGQAGGTAHVGSTVLIGATANCLIAQIDSETVLHLTTGCNSTANQSNALFAWVPDDTASYAIAMTNAWGNAGRCKPIFVPGGLSGISDSIGNTTVCKNEITNPNNTGAFIGSFGGRTGGYWIILPEFITNAMVGGKCTAGGNGSLPVGCLLSAQGIEVSNMGFYGLENSPASGSRNFAMFSGNFDTRYYNVFAGGFLAGDALFRAFEVGANYYQYVIADGMGRTSFNVGGTNIHAVIQQSFGGDNNNFGLFIGGTNNQIVTDSSGFGPSVANAFAAVDVNGNNSQWFSDNDITLCYGSVANKTIVVDATNGPSAAWLHHMLTCPASGGSVGNTGYVGLTIQNGGKVFADNSIFNGGTVGGGVVLTQATSAFFNLSGNIFPASVNTGITPTCSSTGLNQTACTVSGFNEYGTITVTAGAGAAATGTITLTFAGTPSQNGTNAPKCDYQYDNTGTGAWTAPVVTTLGAQSNTSSIFNWAATAPTNTLTYKIGYACIPL